MTPLEKISCFLAESNLIEEYESDPDQYFGYISGPDPTTNIVVQNSTTAWRSMTKGGRVKCCNWVLLKKENLTTSAIRKLHMLLMHDLLEESECGVYRTRGGSVDSYNLPPASKIRALMTAFIKCFAEGKTDPLTMHFEFEKIHPFADGNGRVGRLLWAWDKLRRGEEVHPILDNFDGDDFEEKRQEYYSALQAYHG